jgi:plasmid maintenance system antidote protein VapI
VSVEPRSFFGTSPEFWLSLQNLYELRLAQQKTGKIIKNLPTLKLREQLAAR